MSPQLDVFEELRQAAMRRLKPDHAPPVLGKSLPPDVLERVFARAVRLAHCGLRFTIRRNNDGHPSLWSYVDDADRDMMDSKPNNWGAVATLLKKAGVVRERGRVRAPMRHRVTLWEWTGK